MSLYWKQFRMFETRTILTENSFTQKRKQKIKEINPHSLSDAKLPKYAASR